MWQLQAAIEHTNKVSELLAKDVRFSFSLLIPTKTVPKIKHALAQPLGVAQQFALSANGSRRLKYRLTQDLSFALDVLSLGKKLSVNDRINHSFYPEMIFGWCLSRVIHFVVSLWLHHPVSRILIAKYDYTDAYWRMAHDAKAAAQTIAVH